MTRFVLTGASSGIGAALAAELLEPGGSALLIARSETKLEGIADRLTVSGASVETRALDVTDAHEMDRALTAFDAHAPVDLVIANAGVSCGAGEDGCPESVDDARRVIAVNVLGALNTISPILPAMRARRAGHLVLVSSLAALRPLPSMPAYGASKAALRAYGTALRGAERRHGITVTLVCPGFVTTPMSQRHLGVRPFEVPVDVAARRIARGVRRRQALVTFPWPLALLTWLGARLPPHLSDRMIAPFAAEILPQDR